MAYASSRPSPILDLALHDDENHQYLPSSPMPIGRLFTVVTKNKNDKNCRATILVQLAGTSKIWALLPAKFCAKETVEELLPTTFITLDDDDRTSSRVTCEYLMKRTGNVWMMRLTESLPQEILGNYAGTPLVPMCRRQSTRAIMDTETVFLHRFGNGSYLTIKPWQKAVEYSDIEKNIKNWIAFPIGPNTAAQLQEEDIGALMIMHPVVGNPPIEACGTYCGLIQHHVEGTCLIVAPLWAALNELGSLPEFAPGQLRVLLPIAKEVIHPVTEVADSTTPAVDSLPDTGYGSQYSCNEN